MTNDRDDEDQLPDPMELFLRMRGEQTLEVSGDQLRDAVARLRDSAGTPEAESELEPEPEPEGSEDDLPDPDQLFREMPTQQASDMTIGVNFPELDELDSLDLVEEEIGQENNGLPDPAALFELMQRDQDEEPPFEQRAQPDSGIPEPSKLPTPEELFQQYRREVEKAPDAEPEESPGPLPLPTGEVDLPVPEEPPPPTIEPPKIVMEAPETPAPPPEKDSSSSLFQRVKKRFQKPGPSALPTPEELFREYREEEPEPEPEPENSRLPSPEQLFRQFEEEEKARLDPDLETDLSGPQRFVPTVSDSMFTGTSPSDSFFQKKKPEKPRIEEPQEPPAEKTLPRPMAGNLPVPEPWEEEPEQTPKPTAAKPAPPPRRAPEPKPERPPVPPPELAPKPPLSRPTGTVKVDFSEENLVEQKAVYRPASRPSRTEDNSILHAGTARTPVRRSGTLERRESGKKKSPKKKPRFKRFSRYKLAVFTRQLAVMIRSGIQLHSAITFAAEADPEMRPLLEDVVKKVETGYSFANAISSSSRSFDPVYIGLVQAGELSGRLPEMLTRLADVLEREVEIRKKVISTITYPAVLFCVCLLGTLGFIFFVLPTLTPLFEDLKVPLPLPTKILLASRHFIIPGVVIAVVAGILGFLLRDKISDYIKSRPPLERRLSGLPFQLPVFGEVYEKVVTARVLYSLSTMLDVGITLNQALARAETTAGNALTAHRLSRARMDLADGVGVTDCFRMNELFNPSALHLISAGEEAAKLAEMFQFVARLFDEEVEYALQGATAMLEPLIMVFMGLIVGFITIAAALPTIQLLQNFS